MIKGLHQNPGISTNCNQPSPIAPRIGLPQKSVGDPPEVPQCRHNLLQFRAIQRIGTGLQIQCNPVSTRPTGLRIATERPRASHSRPSFAIHPVQSNPGRSRHDQTRLQLDCETTKDCNVIGRIALKLYGLQVNCSNYTSHSGIEASNPSNLLQSSCNPKSPYNPLQSRQNN